MFVERDALWLEIRSGAQDVLLFCLTGREELGAVSRIKEPEYGDGMWVVTQLAGIDCVEPNSFENHIGPGRCDLLFLTRAGREKVSSIRLAEEPVDTDGAWADCSKVICAGDIGGCDGPIYRRIAAGQ